VFLQTVRAAAALAAGPRNDDPAAAGVADGLTAEGAAGALGAAAVEDEVAPGLLGSYPLQPASPQSISEKTHHDGN